MAPSQRSWQIKALRCERWDAARLTRSPWEDGGFPGVRLIAWIPRPGSGPPDTANTWRRKASIGALLFLWAPNVSLSLPLIVFMG